jgi:hypothetical protein
MSRPVKLARKLLNEISSETGDSPFETIYYLMEILENKDDPDPEEIQLVTEIYQIIEKMKLLEGRLRKYVSEDIKHNSMNKLYELYDIKERVGSSKFFKD